MSSVYFATSPQPELYRYLNIRKKSATALFLSYIRGFSYGAFEATRNSCFSHL